MDTRKTVLVAYGLIPLLAKPMLTQDAFLIANAWATNKGSVNWCMNLLNLLRVGMNLSSLATISAVVQGQIGDLVMPLAYLSRMMKTKVLEACLPGLAPKPDVVAGSSNLALENLLTKIGEIQVTAMEKEEIWRAEKEAPKPLKTQYPEGGQYKTLCTLTGSDADNPHSFPNVYQKIANATKKVGITWIVQHHITGLAQQRSITPPVVQVGCTTCFVTLEFHGEDNTINTGCLLF